MKKPLISQVLRAYEKHNYKIWDGHDSKGKFKVLDLNIFGIRSKKLNQSDDMFDDIIGVFYKMNENNTDMRSWAGTTDPGKYYLENPMNHQGTFIMVPGQYVGAYSIGKHHTQDALVQTGLLKGYRDNNKDIIMDTDPSKIYNGFNFGVNIHHAGIDNNEFIGKWSAGCQVFQNKSDHEKLMNFCHQASKIWGNSFTYTLFNEEDIFE